MAEPRKIVYLFGAGATQAEKMYSLRKVKVDWRAEGLTNSDVSPRVLTNLFENNETRYLISKYGLDEKGLKFPSEYGNDIDIEFLITLIESNKTEQSVKDAKILRDYYKEDILSKLKYGGNDIGNSLYLALLELQNPDEKVLGYITLNYDSLFEKALNDSTLKIDYGAWVGDSPGIQGNETLIKLHGSFDWFLNQETSKIQIRDSEAQKSEPPCPNHQEIEPLWIPPGLVKGYTDYPYNLLFGRARELLVECDLLRIIGCSLSSNDVLLISLIFGTQKLKRGGYSIEIIDGPKAYGNVLKRLGFMIKFEELFYKTTRYGELNMPPPENPFRDWLLFKSKDMPPEDFKRTKYLRAMEW